MQVFEEIFRLLRPVKVSDKIRLGRNWDGGYILSQKMFQASDTLVSLGINDEWSFEAACLRTKKFKQLVMIDDRGSDQELWNQFYRSIKTITKNFNKTEFNLFKFNIKKILRYKLLVQYGKVKYHKARIGLGVNEISLAQLFQRENIEGGRNNILLKMDIEGSEFQMIEEIVNGHQHYSGVVVEFHDILKEPEVMKKALIEMKKQFEIIHVHFNNYSALNEWVADVIEVTFMHKSLVPSTELETELYPINGLDFPCHRGKPDYIMDWTK